MKLAKKMLVSVLALAMVAALALTAFAAAPALVVTASDAIVGQEVTVSISGKDMAGLESADLILNYDTEIFDFVKVEKAVGAGYDMLAGKEIEDGVVTGSFIYQESADSDTPLVTLTLKAAKVGEGKVTVKVDSWDGTEAPADVEITITVKEPAAPTTTPTTAAPTTAEPTTGGKGEIDKTGETGVAIIAGVMAVAAVAFVATRKKDEQ